jgi:hypothetical protein
MSVVHRGALGRRLDAVAIVATLIATAAAAPAVAALTEVTPTFVRINSLGKPVLNSPGFVAIAPNPDGSANHVYVTDGQLNEVVQYAPDGQTDGTSFDPTDYPIDPGNTAGPLGSPDSVAVDPASQDVFIGEGTGQRVLELSPAGTPVGQYPPPLALTGCPGHCPAGQTKPGTFNGPASLIFDGETLIVNDSANDRLETFNTSLAFQTTIALGTQANALAVDPVTHELFVARNTDVDVLTPAGVLERQIGAGVIGNAAGVALDATTHVLFVSDGNANELRTFDEATGAPLQTAAVATTAGPAGLALDPVNHILYVADPGIQTVRRYSFSAPPACSPATTQNAASVALTLTCTDPDGAPVTYAIVQPPTHGTATIDPATGQTTYTPQAGSTQADSFTFDARSINGTGPPVTVTIAATPATPPPTTPGGTTPPPTTTVAPPAEHVSSDIARSSGRVLIRLPGSTTYVSLTTATNVPLGTFVDARAGHVTVEVAIAAAGDTQTGTFYGGRFQILQTAGANPVANMRLFGGTFHGKAPKDDTPSGPAGARAARAKAKAKKKPTPVRHLWGDVHGNFRTTGRGASASVRGTQWKLTDYPTWTSVHVERGSVAVRDFHRHRTVLVTTGHTYTTPH